MNVQDNLIKAKKIIEEHANSSDLIVFPELYSVGYYMDKKYLNETAEPINGNFIEKIKLLALKNGVFIAMPFLEKCKGTLYNSVAIINKSGKVIGVKRKAINWKTELGYISEGELSKELEIYEIDGLKLGVLICYEASLPETSRILAEKGCDFIIVPSFWSNDALSHWDIQLRARAVDNNIYIIGVNGLLESRSCGKTIIISPNGDIIDALEKEEGVLKGLIEKEEVIKIRNKTHYFDDYNNYFKKNM